MAEAKIRLFVDQPLGPGQAIPLSPDQSHYLFGVMRLGAGQPVLVFNGRDGEWRADVVTANRRAGQLAAVGPTAPLRPLPDLWLAFAPLRKARTDFVVEKAVELGAARILPVQTRYTNAERIRQDRLRAHAIEAAEQCGATAVPEVLDLQPLDRVLAGWPADRPILWGDESLAGRPAHLPERKAGQGWGILVGPEGGFSPEEQARLRALPQVVPVSLGPRILRAETAALAAMVLWQLRYGDWA